MPPLARMADAMASVNRKWRIPRVWARAREHLPTALLILALAALFAFAGDRGWFYRSPVHAENSAKNLAIAENLSLAENFRLFRAKRLDWSGALYYDMYGRFPIGGIALIKLATAPFDALSAKLTAARTLAALMLCGAALCAYLAVSRLASSRWIGLSAALIAFSSYYALYYADEVSNESAMDIFGVMLAFHGMVAFVQDGRFRQLILKACAALLVGWHVYALLLAFIVFGLAGAIAARLRGRSDSDNRAIRGDGGDSRASPFAALIRNRYIALGAAALVFGIIVLGANLANEYAAYREGASRTPSPSISSALYRAGVRERAGARWEEWDWALFASRQLYRAGGASLPYALPWKLGDPEPYSPPPLGVAAGVLAVGGAALGAAFARRHRALWATLALFGFFWALPMRAYAYSQWRDFEAMIYVGVPLALVALALMRARNLWGGRALVAAAVAAVAVFAASAYQMGNLAEYPDTAESQKAEMADYDAIREKTRGKVVAVSPEVIGRQDYERDHLEFYLAGSVLAKDDPPTFPQIGRADFVISRQRDYLGFAPLTPENGAIFLHAAPRDPADWRRAERRRAESGEPAARSAFDLYLHADDATGYTMLYYIKDPCAEGDRGGRFFLSVHPVDVADLPAERRALGHDALNFDFSQRGTPVFDGACMAKSRLPGYPIRAIETGQWLPGDAGGTLWRATITPPLSEKSIARYESLYESAKSSGEPLIRSGFDVYLEDGALIYLKEPCAESDARGRFFLSVHPVDSADLPAARRALGHDALKFDFSPDGVVFGGKCMARRELPSYPIRKIATGQDAPGGGRLWAGEAAIGGAR